ncbi:MAG: hypothetical protein Q4F38_09080 [Akkermansia sp.]|nr:hypothetical protein [Akkermansia sp.]
MKKSMTYGEIAEMINDWLSMLQPAASDICLEIKGQELFQVARADKLLLQVVDAFLGEAAFPDLARKWVIVLHTRLTYARDLFLSRHQHGDYAEKKYDMQEVAGMIRNAVTSMWHIQGLEWLLLYRGGIAAVESCPDWKLCESARWAMLEYGEAASWGYTPGNITQDPPTYTHDRIKSLIFDLMERMGGDDFPSESTPFYIDDVREAKSLDDVEGFAWLMRQLMKDPQFSTNSVFRVLRFQKRMMFVLDYFETLPPMEPVSRREAFALITLIATIAWAACGEAWLRYVPNPTRACDGAAWKKLYSAIAGIHERERAVLRILEVSQPPVYLR